MTIHIFKNPESNNTIKLELDGTPAERGGGNPSNSYCGTRVSFQFFNLTVPNEWEEITFNTVERQEKINSVLPIIIKDAGFYIFGADIDIVSDVINDFKLGARIITNGTNEILRHYIRIKHAGKSQNETFNDYQYFKQGDVITLEVTHSIGINIAEYAALWVFRLDESDEIPKARYIKHYFPFEETSGNREDIVNNEILFSSINSPSSTNAVINNGASFTASNLQSLTNSSIDILSYEDGFTISGWISVTSPSSSYSVIAAKWEGGTGSNNNQYMLYFDHITRKFRFAFRENDGVYRIISSEIIPTPSTFHNVTITYNKVSNYIRLYVNSLSKASFKTKGFYPNSSQPFSVGGYNIVSGDPKFHSSCVIDELYIACREFSEDEIADIYNDGNPLNYAGIVANDGDLGEGGSGVGGVINASNVLYDNTLANIQNNPTNVQDAIDELDNIIDGLSAGNVLHYQQAIMLPNWVFHPATDTFMYEIPFSTHGLNNPSFIDISKLDGGQYYFGAHCESRVDSTTKDIFLHVNNLPDGRFTGRISIISI